MAFPHVVVLQFHHARGRKFGPIPDYAARGRGTRDKPVRVAIVGGGASGIAAAWHLRHSREAREGTVTFTLPEKNDYLGGHAFSAPYTYRDDGSGDAETGTTHRFDMGFIFGASGGYDQFRAWAALYDARPKSTFAEGTNFFYTAMRCRSYGGHS